MPRLIHAIRRVRRTANQVLGRDVWTRVEVRRPTVYLGSDYGGYTLCNEGLGDAPVVYSFGVGQDISFERALIETYGASVWAFDPTPGVAGWLAGQSVPGGLHFEPIGLAGRDGEGWFARMRDRNWVNYTAQAGPRTTGQGVRVPFESLGTIAGRLGHRRIDVLKLDIEGSEYEVIDELVNLDVPVGQLLVEFHHRLRGLSPATTARALAALRERGFRIFAISPNGWDYGLVND